MKAISSEINPVLHPVSTIKRAAKDAAFSANQAPSDAEIQVITQAPSNLSVRDPIVIPVINGQGIGLKFSVDKDTGTRIIQVINVDTGEVVRQIPSEEVIAFLHQLEERKGTLLSIKS